MSVVILLTLVVSVTAEAKRKPFVMLGLAEKAQLGEYSNRVIPIVCYNKKAKKKKRWISGDSCTEKIQTESLLMLLDNSLQPIGSMKVDEMAPSTLAEDVGTLLLLGGAEYEKKGKSVYAYWSTSDEPLTPFPFKQQKRSSAEFKEYITEYFTESKVDEEFLQSIYVAKVHKVDLDLDGKDEFLMFAASMRTEGDIQAIGVLLLVTQNPSDDSMVYVPIDLQKLGTPEELAEYAPISYPDIDLDGKPELVVRYNAASFGGTSVFKLNFKTKRKKKTVSVQKVGEYHWGH